MLLLVGDREPVFDEDDARAHQHSFELRHGAEELLALLVRAEAHDALDAGAVVPAAVEQNDLAAGRQMADVALEVPLRALALVRRRQRRDAADARIEALRDALDDAALAGRIAPFEDHDDLELLRDDPVLQLDELALQPEQLLEVELADPCPPARADRTFRRAACRAARRRAPSPAPHRSCRRDRREPAWSDPWHVYRYSLYLSRFRSKAPHAWTAHTRGHRLTSGARRTCGRGARSAGARKHDHPHRQRDDRASDNAEVDRA